MASALLSCKNLSAAVNEKTILHGIDLAVQPGEVHVLMGPNGAGKSTLGHVLMGDPTYEVTEGGIEFDGADITELPTNKRSRAGLFLSFQAPVEIPGVPLRSFLRAMLDAHGTQMKNKQFKKRIQELAETLDMNPAQLDRELGVGFSGGEKKKVEMLQLLLLQPKLAILDETDSGLDIDALRIVAEGVNKLKTPENSCIVITHYQRLLDYIKPDVVHVLYKGRIVKTAGPELALEIEKRGFDWIKKELGE